MSRSNIPKATAKRLPLYYRFIQNLSASGVQRISSAELSKAMEIDSATIRRDFSYFGPLGKKGYGYNVEYLLAFFSKTLSQDELTRVALIGVGHLGTAFINYNFLKKNHTLIEMAFDVREDLVGKEMSDVPIFHLDEMKERLHSADIKVAILTVPSSVAQETTDLLVAAGVEAILNFTPIRLVVPPEVQLHYIDLSVELQSLVFFWRNYK